MSLKCDAPKIWLINETILSNFWVKTNKDPTTWFNYPFWHLEDDLLVEIPMNPNNKINQKKQLLTINSNNSTNNEYILITFLPGRKWIVGPPVTSTATTPANWNIM